MSRCRFVVVAWVAAALLGTLSCGEVKEDVDASSSPTIDAAAIDASATTPDANPGPDASAAPDAAPPDADMRECTAPEQCPGEDTECRTRTCVDYTCGFSDASAGDSCNGGTMICDGAGGCVECLTNDQCPGEICRDRSCVPATCDDLESNGDETDIDCGGSCPPCANDRMCGDATDCVSGYCTGGTCMACGSHADCAAAGSSYCDMASGTCVAKLGQGTICSEPAQCVSGNCADDRCCDLACTGRCEACDQLGLLGQCRPLASGTDPDNECAGTGLCGGTCDGSRNCYYPPASTKCGTCTSCDGGGFCNNFAAVNTDPFSDCASCFACNGGNSCVPVTAGTDPLSDCSAQSAATCGRDGSCNGTGSCALWDDTTVCSAASCASGVAQPADYCDGAGTCTESGTISCDGFACAGGACRTSCSSDSHCVAGYSCDVTSGTCFVKRDNGADCTTDSGCVSGYCTDGVCCNARCDGTCESCLAVETSDTDGQCKPIRAGSDPASECAPGASCDGSGACLCPCETETCVSRGYECGILTCVSDAATCFSDERTCGTSEEPWAGWDTNHLPIIGDLSIDLPAVGPLTGYCGKATSPIGYASSAVIVVGDGGYSSGVEYRYFGGLAFDLSSLPPDAQIVSATAWVYQSNILNNVYTTPMNKIIAEHVQVAALGELCDTAPIEKGFIERDLSTTATLGWKSANVTEGVRWDFATCRGQSQFRLQFSPQNGRNDSVHNRAELTSDNALSENVPYLRVRFRRP